MQRANMQHQARNPLYHFEFRSCWLGCQVDNLHFGFRSTATAADALPGTCEQKDLPFASDFVSDVGRYSGFPAFNLADGTLIEKQISRGGVRKPSDLRLKLDAETVLPVEPVSGLVSECFFFYVVIYASPERPPKGTCQISLACQARFSEDLDESMPAHLADKPTALRVDLVKVSGAGKPWELEPLDTSGATTVVADFSEAGLKASAGFLSLGPSELEGAPLRLRTGSSGVLALLRAGRSYGCCTWHRALEKSCERRAEV